MNNQLTLELTKTPDELANLAESNSSGAEERGDTITSQYKENSSQCQDIHISQHNFIGQAHLLPGLSREKVEAILRHLPGDIDSWTDETLAQTTAKIMESCPVSVTEIIGWIDAAGGRLEAREGEKLVVKGIAVTETMSQAIKYHKAKLWRYVSAFPGGCWPTKGGDVIEAKKK